MQSWNHFTIPKNEDFLDSDFVTYLTEESKELFERGRPGQGYIGLLELATGKIHLYPSFNKDDGLLAVDKEGNPFHGAMRSRDRLGSNQQDLHNQAVVLAGLQSIGGSSGGVVGFGLWKAGYSVRIGSESLLNSTALIPNDYILIPKGDSWQLFYVDTTYETDHRLKTINITSDFPQLNQIMERYKNFQIDPTLNENEQLILENKRRQEIEEAIKHYHEENRLEQRQNKLGMQIKFMKNRSTSQNMHAIRYVNAYLHFFRDSMNANSVAGATHVQVLPREAPEPVFRKIMNEVTTGIEKRKLRDYEFRELTDPMIVGHFENGNYWLSDDSLVSENLLAEIVPYTAPSASSHVPNMKLIDMWLNHPDIDPNYESQEIAFGDRIQAAPEALQGRTPLTEAVLHGNTEVINALLQHPKIDPNKARSKDGETPLTLAIKNNDIIVVKMLLQHKDIDIFKKNLDGIAPVELAEKNIPIRQLLQEHPRSAPVNKSRVSMKGIFVGDTSIKKKIVNDAISEKSKAVRKKT